MARERSQIDFQQPVMFSSFGDRLGYYGPRVSGRYLSNILIDHTEQQREYLDKEVKLRHGEIWRWDLSYKVTMRLVRIGGEQLYGALVTVTNEYNEIRAQFFVMSDNFEQFIVQVRRMVQTEKAYGRPGPKE